MAKTVAFVLGGGGARGALQVGALRALLESGFQPDLVVGTSIGALNAAFVALHGFSKDSLNLLAATWIQAANMELLPKNYLWMTLRAMVGGKSFDPSSRVREFLVAQGLTPELRFSDLRQPRLAVVSADLNTGAPVLHGESPDDQVLEAVLLSTALPPWFLPAKKGGRYLMDGGVVSNLPIEPALRLGATEIVALDIADTREAPGEGRGFGRFVERVVAATVKRQADVELELARARGVPSLYMGLLSSAVIPLWDFRHTEELLAQGYEAARGLLAAQPAGDAEER